MRKFSVAVFSGLLILVLAAQALAVNYTEEVPLPELGSDTYLGVQGGLYPGGSNAIPPAYQAEVDAAIAQLEADNSIGFQCVGMSNLTHTCDELIARAATANVNTAVTIGNAGRPGRTIQVFADTPLNDVWFEHRGLSNSIVDVVVFFNAWGYPSGDFVTYLPQMTDAVRAVYSNVQQAYPNVKLIYFVSREFAPDWAVDLNPNPYAYQDGFAYKAVIEERINGQLSGVPVVWGPYQYDDTWPHDPPPTPSYFRDPDGVHLSDAGLDYAGQLWLDFFMTQAWFAGGPVPTATATFTPGPTLTPSVMPTATETAVPPTPADTPTMTPTSNGQETPTPTPTGCPPWNPLCWATATPRPTFSH